jgi:TRAP transporter 4TM/12TM fusion protein
VTGAGGPESTDDGEDGLGITPTWRWVTETILASVITLIAIAWGLDLLPLLEINPYPAQIVAAILGVSLALAYIHLPLRRGTPRTRVPVYDLAAALLGLVGGVYMALYYPILVDLTTDKPWNTVALGLVLVPLTLEALRRATGNTLPIIVLIFILYGLVGDQIPGRFAALPTEWRVFVGFIALDGNAMPGAPMQIACSMVIVFILFGQLLNLTQGSTFFTELAQVTMGRFRGGPAKIAVLGSALFGSISGSAVANVVATGVVSIPMIKKSGYPAHKAAAIEAAASTGGQLLPPVMGAAAFVMADFLNTSYAAVVIAAAVPGVLYYLALFFQADLEAARSGMRRLDPRDIPPALGLIAGWIFVIPFAVLIFAIFRYNLQPQTAALYSCGALLEIALIFGYRRFRPGPTEILLALRGTGMAVLDLILICAGAGIVIGVLNTGLSFTFTNILVQLGHGNLILLLVLAAGVCIVLGMGLPTLGVYLLLAALVAPGLIEVGVNPMAAHLYVMYFGMMSMLTPPVAIAAYAAAGVARADPMRTGFAAVRFAWLAYVIPFLFVFSPTLILVGRPDLIVASVATAVVGVWLVSAGFAGYFLRPLGPAQRATFVAAGLLALLPFGAFKSAGYLSVAGVVLGIALIVVEISAQRALRRSGPAAT